MNTKWYKIEDLQKLEKDCNINIAYCEIIADSSNADLTRQRILKQGNKYYYHKMQKGQVINCFEIALHRDISYFYDDIDLCCEFWFTSDNLHITEITVKTKRNALEQIEKSGFSFEIKSLNASQIVNGMQIVYKDFVITYIDENHIKFDDKTMLVENDKSFVCKPLKTKIKANDGAKGLFIFFDKECYGGFNNTFEKEYKNGYSLWLNDYKKLFTEFDGNITEYKKARR